MDNSNQKNKYGAIGVLVGFIALCLGLLSPSIASAIDPEPKPIEEVVIDFASRLKDAAVAKASGEEYVSEYEESEKPSRFLIPIISIIGLLATGLGLAAAIKRENRYISRLAIGLGVAGPLLAWSFAIAGALLFIILLSAIFGDAGIDISV